MCDANKQAYSPLAEMYSVTQARECAAYILRRYVGVPIAKTWRLDTAADFDKAVARLAGALRFRAGGTQRAAVADALHVLDVDWSETTAGQRHNLVRQALAMARAQVSTVPELLHPTFAAAANDVAHAARASVKAMGRLAVGNALSALDQRMMAFMTRSHVMFVRDAYGRRLEAFTAQVRAAVAEGMALGLGRDDIAGRLKDLAEKTLLGRTPFYWEVVAGAFVGGGRAFAQVSAYADGGITRYRIEAVLDERTSNVCRFLHGKIFSVRDAIKSFDGATRAQNPEAVRALNPWPQERGGAIYTRTGDGSRLIAQVIRPGTGAHSDLGTTTGAFTM